MKTFTTLRNTTAKFCNVSINDTVKLTLIDVNINDSIRTMCNLHGGKLRFLEATKNMATVADQEGYQIPNGFRKLIDMYVYSESTASSTAAIYTPEMVFDPTKWARIKQALLGSQNVPYFTYVENRKFYMQPIPQTTGNLITLRGRLQTKDLTIADYTTGSIVSIANGGTALVGTLTTWTADMVGRYIQITETTAANGGDGFWYEIGAYVSATALTLTKPYEGLVIAGTAAYTLGQVSAIPEAYDVGICYRSAALYWQNQNDLVRAKSYWLQYDGGKEAGLARDYGGIVSEMIITEGEQEEGSYIAPFGSTSPFPNNGPYYFPFQDASGF